MDDNEHKKYTGVSVKLILENLERLSKAGCNIWVRVPIIPGVNDSEINISRLGEFISNLNVKQVNLLPYHNTAIDKYQRLEKNYALKNIQSPSDKNMNDISERLKEYGLTVKIGG